MTASFWKHLSVCMRTTELSWKAPWATASPEYSSGLEGPAWDQIHSYCTSQAVVLLVSLHFQPDQWTGYSMGCSWHQQSSSLLQTVEICGLQTVCHCLSGLFLGCHGLWKDIASSQWFIMMRSWWNCLKPSWVWVYNHQVLVVFPVKYILHSQLPKERKGLGDW